MEKLTDSNRLVKESFYPSISKKLLSDAISFAKTYWNISEQDIDLIMHARKSLLFNKGTTWVKKDNNMLAAFNWIKGINSHKSGDHRGCC